MGNNNQNALQTIRRLTQARREAVDHISGVLETVGQELETSAPQTKTYQNRTGKGVKSYFHRVVRPGESQIIDYIGKNDQPIGVSLDADRNTVKLYIGALRYYLYWVEVKYDFSVMEQEFNRIRELLPKEFENSTTTRKRF